MIYFRIQITDRKSAGIGTVADFIMPAASENVVHAICDIAWPNAYAVTVTKLYTAASPARTGMEREE